MSYQRIPVSLCIPRVDSSVTEEYVREIFKKWNIGNIRRIKEIPLRKEQNYKRIIVDLACDPQKENVQQMKEIMQKNGSVKLVFDMPDFWKIVYTIDQSEKYNRN
jgi:hypothetical protein